MGRGKKKIKNHGFKKNGAKGSKDYKNYEVVSYLNECMKHQANIANKIHEAKNAAVVVESSDDARESTVELHLSKADLISHLVLERHLTSYYERAITSLQKIDSKCLHGSNNVGLFMMAFALQYMIPSRIVDTSELPENIFYIISSALAFNYEHSQINIEFGRLVYDSATAIKHYLIENATGCKVSPSFKLYPAVIKVLLDYLGSLATDIGDCDDEGKCSEDKDVLVPDHLLKVSLLITGIMETMLEHSRKDFEGKLASTDNTKAEVKSYLGRLVTIYNAIKKAISLAFLFRETWWLAGRYLESLRAMEEYFSIIPPAFHSFKYIYTYDFPLPPANGQQEEYLVKGRKVETYTLQSMFISSDIVAMKARYKELQRDIARQSERKKALAAMDDREATAIKRANKARSSRKSRRARVQIETVAEESSCRQELAASKIQESYLDNSDINSPLARFLIAKETIDPIKVFLDLFRAHCNKYDSYIKSAKQSLDTELFAQELLVLERESFVTYDYLNGFMILLDSISVYSIEDQQAIFAKIASKYKEADLRIQETLHRYSSVFCAGKAVARDPRQQHKWAFNRKWISDSLFKCYEDLSDLYEHGLKDDDQVEDLLASLERLAKDARKLYDIKDMKSNIITYRKSLREQFPDLLPDPQQSKGDGAAQKSCLSAEQFAEEIIKETVTQRQQNANDSLYSKDYEDGDYDAMSGYADTNEELDRQRERLLDVRKGVQRIRQRNGTSTQYLQANLVGYQAAHGQQRSGSAQMDANIDNRGSHVPSEVGPLLKI